MADARSASEAPPRLAFGVAVLLLALPAPAAAQWYVATFTGGNVTQPATVRVDQPDRGRQLDFEDVPFASRPLEWPQYYGARLGHRLSGGRVALELEFLHTKVIARTDAVVRVSGRNAGVPIDELGRMDEFVQRYAMTHGLNFFLANIVWRAPLGAARAPRVALELRAGGGPVVPGAYTVVDELEQNGYQFAGFGGQVAAGLDVHVTGWLSALVEYRLTGAQPRLDLAEGRGRTTAISHHLAVGFGLSRWPVP